MAKQIKSMKKLAILSLILMSYCNNNRHIDANAVAIVNHRAISKQDFSEQAQSISTTPGVNLGSKDGRTAILKDMINEELIFQEALKDQFYLKSLGVKHEIVKDYLKQKFTKDIPVISDDKVEAFYKQHQNEYDFVRASHILIRPTSNDAAAKKQARDKLVSILSDIHRGKISFADAASQYSDDSSKKTQGDLGFFQRGQMVESFSNAAFGLKNDGDISDVIETSFGYHIIELTGQNRGVEANREKIRWRMYQEVMQPKVDQYFEKLRTSADIKVVNTDLMTIPVSTQ